MRIIGIYELLNLHKDVVSYRIKELGIIATNRWWYDMHQIELIRDYARTPRTKYIYIESKLNNMKL